MFFYSHQPWNTMCYIYGCYERQYKMQNGERVKTGVRMFEFPGSKDEKKKWCCLIKRQEGKDNFRISSSTEVCQKHFLPDKVIRMPGGTRVRLDKSARLIFHSWNNWTVKK